MAAHQRLTLSEMAERLEISTKTFRKQVKDRQIPFYRHGKRMRFDPNEVEAYVKDAEKETRSNVTYLPVPKRRKSIVTSKRFAEAV